MGRFAEALRSSPGARANVSFAGGGGGQGISRTLRATGNQIEATAKPSMKVQSATASQIVTLRIRSLLSSDTMSRATVPHNARHHPPPRAIDLHESRRVGGRVHAVVRFRPRLPLAVAATQLVPDFHDLRPPARAPDLFRDVGRVGDMLGVRMSAGWEYPVEQPDRERQPRPHQNIFTLHRLRPFGDGLPLPFEKVIHP